MKVLQPEQGQTYLYFYEDADLNPERDLSEVKSLLKYIGCKIGPVWNREPEYYICKCEIGEFRLVDDPLAIFIDSESSQVIQFLSQRIIEACHMYQKDSAVHLADGSSAVIRGYAGEDYIIDDGITERQITEAEIMCEKIIPDNVVGKRIKLSFLEPEFMEFPEYGGIVLKMELSDRNIWSITVAFDDDMDADGNVLIYEDTVYEDEIRTIRIIENDSDYQEEYAENVENNTNMKQEEITMKKIYFTLTGTNHYFGNEFLKPGMALKLQKEPENDYDMEAILVKIEGLGKIGYVANSAHTVIGESYSAGRIYDKIGDAAKAKVVLVTSKGTICKICKKSILKNDQKQVEEEINE